MEHVVNLIKSVRRQAEVFMISYVTPFLLVISQVVLVLNSTSLPVVEDEFLQLDRSANLDIDSPLLQPASSISGTTD